MRLHIREKENLGLGNKERRDRIYYVFFFILRDEEIIINNKNNGWVAVESSERRRFAASSLHTYITLRDQTVISKTNVILKNDNTLQLSLHNIHT